MFICKHENTLKSIEFSKVTNNFVRLLYLWQFAMYPYKIQYIYMYSYIKDYLQ